MQAVLQQVSRPSDFHLTLSSCSQTKLTKQPKLTAIIQSRRLTLFGHIMRMDDNADAKRILLASPPADWFGSSSSFLACNSRLRSAIRRHHPPQRAVLSQICCFGERKMVMFQIVLDGAEPCDAGTTQMSSPVCQRGGQQDPLGICVVVHAHNMPK